MIETKEAAALGVIQGLTEYLPVSSSGHLVIAQNLFGLREPELLFDTVLHLGTLAAVVWYYRADIIAALRDSAAALRAIASGSPAAHALDGRPGASLAWFVIAGSVPTAILGLGFQEQFEAMFASLRWVGVMLCVTGAFLFVSRYASGTGRTIEKMGLPTALLIGLVQGLAITPGISRSGATICAALLLGVERETAARFSFILSIPAITGATLLHVNGGPGGSTATALALGFAVSLVVGYMSLALLVSFVRRGRLSWFSYYCFAVGAAVFFM